MEGREKGESRVKKGKSKGEEKEKGQRGKGRGEGRRGPSQLQFLATPLFFVVIFLCHINK